jgi:2'-5' RNA ligase
MARAFVAVQPPATVLDAVDAVEGACATLVGDVPGARWTTREQRHLTLQFLGNRADVDAVAEALQSLASAPADLQLGGGGAFPSARRARVLWVGVARGAEWLGDLAGEVGALLAPLGHEPEDRAYRPHLTLARWKVPTDARPAVERIGDASIGPTWTAGEVVLYESTLRRDGARYVPRTVVSLPERSAG